MKKNIKWIVCGICICLFIVLSILVITKNDIYLDTIVYKFISKFIKASRTPNIIRITNITSASSVIIITLIVLIFFKNKKYGIYMSLNLIIITIFQLVLKNIFLRNRPLDINLIDEKGYSFPSGHSLTSMAFYGFIIYLIYTSKLSKKIKIISITSLVILILMIGISRIYLGVHYATDVIGGFSFSLTYLIIYTNIIKDKITINKM